MLLVVDANVVFSALINKGNPFKVFEANKIFKRFEFVAPDFLFLEIVNKKDKLLSLTKLTRGELNTILSFLKEEINFVSFSEFSDKLPEAIKLDFKDSPYLALALKLGCPIFSGDKKLKGQNKVKILSPKQLLNILGIE